MRSLSRAPIAALLFAIPLACGGQELAVAPPAPPAATPSIAPPAPPAFVPAAVSGPQVNEGTVAKIQARSDVPLGGPRVDAKPGDWMLRHAGNVAVVAAETGRLVDLGPENGRDELVAIDSIAFVGLDIPHFEVDSIEAASDGHALHVIRRVLEKPLFLHTFVYFAGAVVKVESLVTAASPKGAGVSVTLGERVHWGNVPTWVEGHGFITRGGAFAGDFLARDSFGTAYALCSENGRLEARFGWPDPAGFHEAARTGEEAVLVAADAPTPKRIMAIARSSRSIGDAALALPCVRRDGGGGEAKVPDALPKTARVEIARCPARGRGPAPWARFAPDEASIALPGGCFQMRLAAPGHTPSAWFSTAASFGRTLPPAGKLRFAVAEHGGGPIPARVVVRGIKGTPDPDWGDDPDEGAALNVVYADKGAGERPLPPGKYKVTIDHGFEYTAIEKEIGVVASRTTEILGDLKRVVDTKGWISADLHLHAAPSSDAPQPLADRVRALVAAGVEVGVATDHNAVTDYAPVIRELGLTGRIASVIGDEVTTRDPYYGHFNMFPLAAGSPPIEWRNTTPKAIFSASRAGPGGSAETIVQVNHPRMGDIGYFDLLHLDRDDVASWTRRSPLADLSFDAIEVFNGDHYAQIPKVEDVMRDWYALLNAGRRFTATGNSDSHKLTYQEAGTPRNLVALAKDDPAQFDERAFIDAVRKGKVTVSSGPFVTIEAGGVGIGETVGEGQVEVTIRADGPAWVDIDRVELVRRGEVIRTFVPPFPKGSRRFEAKVTETLHKGDWIIAIARGTKPMTFLYRSGAKPFAFTNPIFVN